MFRSAQVTPDGSEASRPRIFAAKFLLNWDTVLSGSSSKNGTASLVPRLAPEGDIALPILPSTRTSASMPGSPLPLKQTLTLTSWIRMVATSLPLARGRCGYLFASPFLLAVGYEGGFFWA